MVSGAGALADPPPQPPAASATPSQSPIVAPVDAPRPGANGNPPVGQVSSKAHSDEDLMEFLGGDDVGDAAWEFLKNSPPSKPVRPAPPQQDTAS